MNIEGLTGNISFKNEGKRSDYLLDVVEMTVNSETVKVITIPSVGVSVSDRVSVSGCQWQGAMVWQIH